MTNVIKLDPSLCTPVRFTCDPCHIDVIVRKTPDALERWQAEWHARHRGCANGNPPPQTKQRFNRV